MSQPHPPKNPEEPLRILIKQVMSSCGCEEAMAKTLLEMNDNNPLKAKICFDNLNTTPVSDNESDLATVGTAAEGSESAAVVKFVAGGRVPTSRSTQTDAQALQVRRKAAHGDEDGEDNQDLQIAKAPDDSEALLEESSESSASDDHADDESSQVGEPVKKEPWNMLLPHLLVLEPLAPGVPFEIENFIAAIQMDTPNKKTHMQDLLEYLRYQNKDTLHQAFNSTIQEIPVMFYIVASNDEELIRACIAAGGDVNAVHQESGMPLLAFTTMQSETLDADTTAAVVALLILGADPEVIPPGYYTKFNRDLPKGGPEEGDGFTEADHPTLIMGDDTATKDRLMKQLSREIKKGFLQSMGAPLTGRISSFMPFLIFSSDEQSVLIDSNIRYFVQEVRKPIDLSLMNGRMVGNIKVTIKDVTKVIEAIREGYYDENLGARSLKKATRSEIEELVVEKFLELETMIVEGGEVTNMVVSEHEGEILVYVERTRKERVIP